MNCVFCKGKITDGLTTDVTDLISCVIIIRNVPCHKCTQCGEISFNIDVSERLEKIVDTLKKEKAALDEELSRMRVEANELNKKIYDMTRERDDVKEKVERMVARLEAIEL